MFEGKTCETDMNMIDDSLCGKPAEAKWQYNMGFWPMAYGTVYLCERHNQSIFNNMKNLINLQ